MKNPRLCSYIVRFDTGLAPNPFWNYCTLAVCTPNHMNVKAKKGDWFVGFSTKNEGYKLIYAMEVDEILNFDEYYHDSRFINKRPKINGNWKERYGDNMYFKDDKGEWQQCETENHKLNEEFKKDIKNPNVFIAQHFYYFGNNSIQVPNNYQELVWQRQGVKCSHDPKLVERFINWLKKNYLPGLHGSPKLNNQDNDESENCSKKPKKVNRNMKCKGC